MPACWDIDEKRAGSTALWSGNGWKPLRLWDHRGTCRSPLSAEKWEWAKCRDSASCCWMCKSHLHLQQSPSSSSELSVHLNPWSPPGAETHFWQSLASNVSDEVKKPLMMNDNGITGQRESFFLIARDRFNESRAQNKENREKIGSRTGPAVTAESQLPGAREQQWYQGAALPLQGTNNSHWNQWHFLMFSGIKWSLLFSALLLQGGAARVCVQFVLSAQELSWQTVKTLSAQQRGSRSLSEGEPGPQGCVQPLGLFAWLHSHFLSCWQVSSFNEALSSALPWSPLHFEAEKDFSFEFPLLPCIPSYQPHVRM